MSHACLESRQKVTDQKSISHCVGQCKLNCSRASPPPVPPLLIGQGGVRHSKKEVLRSSEGGLVGLS